MSNIDTFDDLSVEGSQPKKSTWDKVTSFFDEPDTFDDLSVEGSSKKPSTRNQSMMQAVGRETAQTSTAIAAGAAAFRTLAPTGNPYVVTGGTAAAAIGGYALGDKYADYLGIPEIRDMPAEDRPYAYGAESFAGSALAAVPILGALSFGVKATNVGIGKLFNQIVRMGHQSPKLFAAVETIPAATTAIAAGVSEKVAPGSDLVRLGSQVGAGLLTSGLLLRGGLEASSKVYGATVNRFGSAKAQARGVKTIEDLLKTEGLNPEDLVRAAKKAGFENLTVGQFTAHPVAMAIERDLMKHNEKFARGSVAETQAAFDLIRMRINLLAQSTDPDVLKSAALMRQKMLGTMIEMKIANKSEELAATLAPLIRDGRISEEAISQQGFDALSVTLKQAEGHMDTLWGEVDLAAQVGVSALEKEVRRIVYKGGKYLGPGKIPSDVMDMIDDSYKVSKGTLQLVGPNGMPLREVNPVTEFRNMKSARSNLLQKARAARIAGLDDDANTYNSLAAAILDDMDTSLGKEGANDAYNLARAFTREFHDVFSRSFAGKAMASSRFGERMDPGVMLRKSMAGGNVAAHEQMADLAEATRFMRSKNLADNTAVDAMMDAQARAIKIMSMGSFEEKTGRINTKTLQGFLDRHEALLRNQFPEVRAEMMAALKSEDALRAMEMRAAGIKNLVGTQSAFAKISRTDPVAFASEVLRSTNNQESKIVAMLNTAKRGGRGVDPKVAQDSVKASLYDAAINMSMRGNELDIEAFRRHLFNSKVVGKKSPMNVLLEHGAVTSDEVKELREMFNVFDNVTTWLKQGSALDAGDKTGSALRTFFAKVGGSLGLSSVKKATGVQGGSADLIIHGQVANLMDKVANKIPAANQKNVILALMMDRQAFVKAMTSPKDATQAAETARFLNAWLYQWGFSTEESLVDKITAEERTPVDNYTGTW
jgi:hypothetical protein